MRIPTSPWLGELGSQLPAEEGQGRALWHKGGRWAHQGPSTGGGSYPDEAPVRGTNGLGFLPALTVPTDKGVASH